MHDIIDLGEVEARGCGFRQKGGFYFTGEVPEEVTSFFPMTTKCTCGHEVVRPARGCQDFYPGALWGKRDDIRPNPYFGLSPDKKCWAATVDLKGYPTPDDYIREAEMRGISRRLNNGLPKGFKIGEDTLFIIHGRAVKTEDGKYEPGFIMAIKPRRCEYVVIGNESKEYLDGLVKKGITLVSVANARPAK